MDQGSMSGSDGQKRDDLRDFLKELEVLRQAAEILGVPVKDIMELRKSRNESSSSQSGKYLMANQMGDLQHSQDLQATPEVSSTSIQQMNLHTSSPSAAGLFDSIDFASLNSSSLTNLIPIPPADPLMEMVPGESSTMHDMGLTFFDEMDQSFFDPSITFGQEPLDFGIYNHQVGHPTSQGMLEMESEVAEYRPEDEQTLESILSDCSNPQVSDGSENAEQGQLFMLALNEGEQCPQHNSDPSNNFTTTNPSADLSSQTSQGSTPTIPESSASGSIAKFRDIRPKDPLLTNRIALVGADHPPDSAPAAVILHKTTGQKIQRRRAFSLCQRQETGETRKNKACIRCHMQRIRCVRNPDDPFGDCQTCAKVKGPTLSQLPCLRYKISDSQLLDKGKHPRFSWTRRWTSMKICEMEDWDSPIIKTITLTQDVGNASYSLQVRKFIPQPGDSLERTWNTADGVKAHPCAPYALANMRETSKVFVNFVDTHIKTFIDHYISKEDPLLFTTYEMAFKHSRLSAIKDERVLLHSVLRLWVGSRMESKQERVSSEEVLGMTPQDWDPTAGNYGKYLVPPVLQAQIEILTTSMILLPMQKEVLKILQSLIEKNMARSWFTIYLTMFILLHSCSMLTRAEGVRAAREGKMGSQARYWNHEIVEKFHSGARTMLAYFHYCNKGGHPFSMDWTRPANVAFAKLGPQQVEFIKDTIKLIQDKRS
ncbi:hypothetical protein F52700_1316 [Fusarium sp. NRRL 52700]|nr:hypothetical protein F52700_1316 [Fusarium sp. NRRL 52700]